jgi:hypothetical protein
MPQVRVCWRLLFTRPGGSSARFYSAITTCIDQGQQRYQLILIVSKSQQNKPVQRDSYNMSLQRILSSTLGLSVGHPHAFLLQLAHGLLLYVCLSLFTSAWAATTVPVEVQMPGSQPGEAGNLESADKCDNCHQDSSPVVNIAHDWRGSMMSHAGRDPIYWATVAIAEQDFDGAGDLCIRCHTMGGWQGGNRGHQADVSANQLGIYPVS